MDEGKKKLKTIKVLIDGLQKRRVVLKAIFDKAKINGKMTNGQKQTALGMLSKINKAKAKLEKDGINANDLRELKKVREKIQTPRTKRWLRDRRKKQWRWCLWAVSVTKVLEVINL